MRTLKLSLLSLVASMSIAATAQTNVTDKYVVNADFDNGAFSNNAPEGWTLSLTSAGIQSKISTGDKANGLIAAGQNHWQLWQPSGNLTGKAYQTLDNLPLGRYKLTAAVVSAFGGGNMGLFIGSDTTEVKGGANKVYEAETLITSGKADIGLCFKTTNGATIDFDSFNLYKLDLNDKDAAALIDDLHALCVKDTLSKGRQKWYNRDEMLAAFDAYHNAGTDAAAITKAVNMLQKAHENFEQITSDYKTLRHGLTDFNAEIQQKNFAYKDSIASMRKQILAWYLKFEDHYEWVKENLVAFNYIKDVYAQYNALLRALSYGYTQMNATQYADGMPALKALLDGSWDVAATAMTIEEFQARIDEVNKGVENYLKTRPSEWVTIKNGQMWYTDKGAAVQAHAPGFVRVGDIWYMCGEDRTRQWNPDVSLYSSVDLVNWKFEKKIVQNGVTTPELGSSRMIERPKLLYNKKTGKFVVWCHYEAGNYGASEAACFECDSVNGAYKYVWSGRPMGVKSRDCNVFQDNDGTAYFISTTEENQHLGLFRLSDDYHSAVEHTQLFAWQRREAPAIVRLDNTYFMFSSACSGWDPNQCKLSYSNNLKTGWSGLSNIGNNIAYDTQAAAILKIEGTKATTYLYVGDRWQDPGLPESKTIIFPISFNGNTCNFKYHERFDINFVTGEWRETPREDTFLDKKKWKILNYSSQEDGSGNATNAIDGNVNTMWHTKYSGGVAEAPHHIAIDLGEECNITSFLVTPRMDGNTNGLIRKYQFLVSNDGKVWRSVRSGDWMPYCTEVFADAQNCRYVKLHVPKGTYASIAEFDIVGSTVTSGIENAVTDTADKKIVSRRLYTIDGTELLHADKGIYIEKITFADGTTKSVKKVKR